MIRNQRGGVKKVLDVGWSLNRSLLVLPGELLSRGLDCGVTTFDEMSQSGHAQ